MKYSIFIVQLDQHNKIEIPKFIVEKLQIEPDDYLEVTVKKIKSKKSQLSIQKNPLLKLIKESS
jgi:bifunctional DNA-binding transcriptional regulator/antitoxin component of YhaV-PrlF toxin-antitoxin module